MSEQNRVRIKLLKDCLGYKQDDELSVRIGYATHLVRKGIAVPVGWELPKGCGCNK